MEWTWPHIPVQGNTAWQTGGTLTVISICACMFKIINNQVSVGFDLYFLLLSSPVCGHQHRLQKPEEGGTWLLNLTTQQVENPDLGSDSSPSLSSMQVEGENMVDSVDDGQLMDPEDIHETWNSEICNSTH